MISIIWLFFIIIIKYPHKYGIATKANDVNINDMFPIINNSLCLYVYLKSLRKADFLMVGLAGSEESVEVSTWLYLIIDCPLSSLIFV